MRYGKYVPKSNYSRLFPSKRNVGQGLSNVSRETEPQMLSNAEAGCSRQDALVCDESLRDARHQTIYPQSYPQGYPPRNSHLAARVLERLHLLVQ